MRRFDLMSDQAPATPPGLHHCLFEATELLDQAAEFLGVLSRQSICFALHTTLRRLLLQPLLDQLAGVNTLFRRNLARRITFQIKPDLRLLDRFQVAQGVRVYAQRDAQVLAIKIGETRQQLLVYSDGQRATVAQDREAVVQIFQELTRARAMGAARIRGIHRSSCRRVRNEFRA